MSKTPVLTTDTIIEYPDGAIVLIVRGKDPFKGKYALPGGHVEIGERVEEAAVREAREETGLDIELTGLFGVYSDPNRDPRGHTCSIVWKARALGGELHAETDAADAIITGDYLDLEYAFDHRQMIEDYVRGKRF